MLCSLIALHGTHRKIDEFQALDSSRLSGVVYDMARMRRLLEITLPERCKTHADPLPRYLLVEEIVSKVLVFLEC